MPTSNFERRSIATELRAAPNFSLEGRAATFGELSKDLGGFQERCTTGCFQRSLREDGDVRILVNHDPSKILGRTKSGTASVSERSDGLWFSVRLDPASSLHKDTYAAVKRGDISECSFAFKAPADGQRWVKEGKQVVRELTSVDLLDCSVVCYPAYAATEVSARALEINTVPDHVKMRAVIKNEQAEWRRQVRRATNLGKIILRDFKLDDEDEFEIDDERAHAELHKQLCDRDAGYRIAHVGKLDKNGNGKLVAFSVTDPEFKAQEFDWTAEPCECEDDCEHWFHSQLGDSRKLSAMELSSLDGRIVEKAKDIHRSFDQERELEARMRSASGRTSR